MRITRKETLKTFVWILSNNSASGRLKMGIGRGAVTQVCWGKNEVRGGAGRILGRNWDKSLKRFPPCYLHTVSLTPTSPTDFIPSSLSWAKVVWNWFVMYHCIRKPQVLEFLRLCPETSSNCTMLNYVSADDIPIHCKDKTPKFRGLSLWAIYLFPRSVCLFCWRKYVDRSLRVMNRIEWRHK